MKRLIAKNHNRLLFIDENNLYEQILLDNFRPGSSRYKNLDVGSLVDDDFKIITKNNLSDSIVNFSEDYQQKIFLLLTTSSLLKDFEKIVNIALFSQKHHIKFSLIFLNSPSDFILRPLSDLKIEYQDFSNDDLFKNIQDLSQNHHLIFTTFADKNAAFKEIKSQKGNIFLKYLYYLSGEEAIVSDIFALELNLFNISFLELSDKKLKFDDSLLNQSLTDINPKFKDIHNLSELYNFYFPNTSKNVLISPSILTLPMNKIKGAIKKLSHSGANYLHFDVMDGIFVSNKTYSISDYLAIKKVSPLINDVHLMVQDVNKFVDEYLASGVDILTFHYEAIEEENLIIELIKKIHHYGVKAGISIKPNTDVQVLLPYLKMIDLILIMSVEPGKGGQTYLDNATDKIYFLDQYRQKHHLTYLLEVDGGINDLTAKVVKAAGVDILVAGTFIVNHSNYRQQIEALKK